MTETETTWPTTHNSGGGRPQLIVTAFAVYEHSPQSYFFDFDMMFPLPTDFGPYPDKRLPVVPFEMQDLVITFLVDPLTLVAGGALNELNLPFSVSGEISGSNRDQYTLYGFEGWKNPDPGQKFVQFTFKAEAGLKTMTKGGGVFTWGAWGG